MFQQIIGVHMGTNCVPVFVYHFVYPPEAAFIRTSIKDKQLQKQKPLILLSGILIMFCQLITQNGVD